MSSAAVRRDAYGLEVTVASPPALELYDRGVRELLSWGTEAGALFARAVEVEEDFALARGMVGLCHFLEERYAQANEAIEGALGLAPLLSRREQQHLQGLALSIQGRAAKAIPLIQEHLREFPRDIVMIQRLYYIYFWQGRSADMLRLTGGTVSHYTDDSFMLGLHSFSLEENGLFAPALRLGEAALALNPKDAWAAHGVAHVLYETGDSARGIAFLPPALERCDQLGPFRVHLTWHLALFHLGAGQYDRVMEIYRRGIRIRRDQVRQELDDAISLLWRNQLYGRDVRELWGDLAHAARERILLPNLIFHDLHLSMAMAAAGDAEGVERQLAHLSERATQSSNPTLREVGLPLLRGLLAYARGDFPGTVAHIEPIRERIIEVGGSHAQREVFHDTLIEAYLRLGQMDRAECLVQQRLHNRPEWGRHWYRLGRIQAGLGRTAEARASLQRVLDLWRDADPDAPERLGARSLLATVSG